MDKKVAILAMGAATIFVGTACGVQTISGRNLVASVQSAPAPAVCTSGNPRCTPTEIELAAKAPPVVNLPAKGAPLTRDAAVRRTAGLSAVVLENSRISAKLTTWETYESASGSGQFGTGPTTGFSPNEQVWLVAVSGKIRPEHAHGLVFPWAVFIYDSASGEPLSLHAKPDGVCRNILTRLRI
jgi:hypothetical protein